MLEKLVASFVSYLRQNKMSVPTSSVEEVVKSLPYYNVAVKEEFRLVLRQVLIKDKELFVRFDECFHEFFYIQFYDKVYEIRKERKEKEAKRELSQLEKKQQKRDAKQEQKKEDKELPWLHSYLENQKGRVAELFLKELEHKLSEDMQDTMNRMGRLSPSDMNDFAEEAMWEAVLSDQPSTIFDAINQVRENLLKTRNEVNKVKKRQEEMLSLVEKPAHSGMRRMVQTEIDLLKDRPIASLNKDQISMLRESLERSSTSLLTKFSKLMKAAKTENEVDMARTISKSLRTFGVPVELAYRTPKKKKTKIDIIQDVSGSVIKSAEFLTLFAYLIHKQFPGQVRTFCFVGKLDETTHFFETEDIDKAIKDSLKHASIDYRGYSNYDMALRIYEENYMDAVDDDTIVFVLGDARNNRNDARVKTMGDLSSKAKHVIWLNPEERGKWNQGDSVIGKYQPYADVVAETRTVNQLVEVLEDITSNMIASS